MSDAAVSSLLQGAIDSHVHGAPDVVPRVVSDLDIARGLAVSGFAGVVLKNHHGSTAGRAALVRQAVPEINVWGGVCLNPHAGGLSPAVVRACAAMGGRVVWLPTFSAPGEVEHSDPANGAAELLAPMWLGESPRPLPLYRRGRLIRDAQAVLSTVAECEMTLATGHTSGEVLVELVHSALSLGVQRVIVTHPEASSVSLSIPNQIELAATGRVWFERVWALTKPPIALPRQKIVEGIRTVGSGTTIVATDYGRRGTGHPVEGMREFVAFLLSEGIAVDEIRSMLTDNPLSALGVQL